jgi:1-acyl-sn-glycerol-3-phosphate acyltransferase
MLSAEQTEWLAVGVVVALSLLLVAWIWRIYRRNPFSFAQFPIYMFCWAITRVLWRAHVEGQVPLGPGQGAVIVCNHVGPVDPAFIALACDRPVHWMVAREFVEHPFFGLPLRILGAIPVNRGGVDTAATKLAIRYAAKGDLVGMFPEGRINETDKLLLPGRPGAALVALKARVPVVPCYISGSPNDGTSYGYFFMPAKTRLLVGKPLDISKHFDIEKDKKILEHLTMGFMKEIAALAGYHDYEPELAGRAWKYPAGQ